MARRPPLHRHRHRRLRPGAVPPQQSGAADGVHRRVLGGGSAAAGTSRSRIGTYGELTPLSLLERARTKDQQAWSRLADLYRPMVLFWCRRAHCPAGDVEDVTQEIFASVATGLPGFRRDRPGDSFRGWLRGITRNQVLLYFRRNHGRPQPVGGSDAHGRLQDLPDPLPDCEEDEAQEVSELYRRAVEQVRGEFEPQTWQIFWRTVIEGRSPAALAEELGITPAAVRQAKSRVLRRLKQEMGALIE